MPIRPENADRYPANWDTISIQVRTDAEWRCECDGRCGTPHPTGRCRWAHGDTRDGTNGPYSVVLTVAHLDHVPEHVDRSNLRAMCQVCHLRYDAPSKASRAKARRRAELEAAGQQHLRL